MTDRIQRKRGVRGYRHPPGTRSVVRGTRWGNPYEVEDYGRDEAIRLYQALAWHELWVDPGWLDLLRGLEHLSCYCRLDQACHVDLLIGLLRQDTPTPPSP